MTERDASRLAHLQALTAEHPLWGYRRIWAYGHVVEPLSINKKRVLRVMREHHLLVQPNRQLNAKRMPSRSTPRPSTPQEWWGIDMTKVMVEGCGWGYLVVVLDWYTKKIVGYYAGTPCTAMHGLEALDMAVNSQFPNGTRSQGVSLIA